MTTNETITYSANRQVQIITNHVTGRVTRLYAVDAACTMYSRTARPMAHR